MAIYDYSRKSHKGGYRALRVSRQIGGEVQQAYFTLDQREAAEALDAKLARAQERFEAKRLKAELTAAQHPDYTNPRYDAPRRTEVVGLSLCFQEQLKCNPVRYYPAFVISCVDTATGKRIQTSRCITTEYSLSSRWREVCKLMADAKGLKRVPSLWYYNEPTPEQFEALRKFYRAKGKKIPVSSLAPINEL